MTNGGQKSPATRWYNSLIFRTIALCVVLLLCLLGSVYVITSHYYTQVVDEMQNQTRSIADDIIVHLTDSPDEELDDLERQFEDDYTEIQLTEDLDEDVPLQVSMHRDERGRMVKTARASFAFQERRFGLTTIVTLSPQSEIVRAFRNRYLLALTIVFLVALGFMVYLIGKTLRPLGELAETCAEIGAGHLRPVEIRRNTGEILALERTFNEMVRSLHDKEVVEARLRQAQRLSAIGNLAAGVAHDLRNPLNAIKLLSGHTMDALEGNPENEQALRQVSTIREEVNRLEEIVSGFLSLAKEHELRVEPCRVDGLLEESIRLVSKDAESRGLRLTVELRAGDTELMLDPKQWARAILNVLINAMEASPDGGRVRVFSRVTDVACEIEIRDDGPGLSDQAGEHAFDPYFSTKPTGTGLGLSITRGIIEEHGGTIELSGSAGSGCQVLITMPFDAASRLQG